VVNERKKEQQFKNNGVEARVELIAALAYHGNLRQSAPKYILHCNVRAVKWKHECN
jgi:hypothetical protein